MAVWLIILDPKAVIPGWENEKLFRGNNLFKNMA
jgi:hypothetical protein